MSDYRFATTLADTTEMCHSPLSVCHSSPEMCHCCVPKHGSYTMSMSARQMFADMLSGYRKQAGLTQLEAARKLNVSVSLYRKLEACEHRHRPQHDFAKNCDELFGTPHLFARLYDEALAEPYPKWFASRVVYEDRASVIHEWDMRVVPGLLQTRGYAQAVIRAGRPYDAEADLIRDIEARMDRQEILSRDEPPKLWAVLTEGVLRQVVGGATVMRAQLDHLIGVADAQGYVVQVVPFDSSDVPGLDGPTTLFEFSDGPPVVYLEDWRAGRVVENPKEVTSITTLFSMIRGCALSPVQSRELMIKIRGEL
jgi:transcriptional regulator with XRE-family HTH domain